MREVFLCQNQLRCNGSCKSVSPRLGRINSSTSIPRALCFFLPSVSPSSWKNFQVNFVLIGWLTQRITHSSRHHAFLCTRSRKNLHTCKLTLAGSRSNVRRWSKMREFGAWGRHTRHVRARIECPGTLHPLHSHFCHSFFVKLHIQTSLRFRIWIICQLIY